MMTPGTVTASLGDAGTFQDHEGAEFGKANVGRCVYIYKYRCVSTNYIKKKHLYNIYMGQ